MWHEISAELSAEFGDLGDAATVTRIAVRLIMAAALGAMLGYERESMGKAAGLRTHMLVALGAALAVLAAIESGADEASVSRVIQGLVAGIGFLGAGAIVKGKIDEEVQGLTTAATIWMTAALGITAGLGREATAIFAALVALVVLRALPRGQQQPPAPPSR